MAADESSGGHGRCGARTRRGTECGRPAGWGTEHPGIGRCKYHGGCTPTHEAAASKELARREADRLGLTIETTPAEALLHAVSEAASNVAFFRALVSQLSTDQVDPGHPHVQLYNEERKRLVDAAAAALRANVEERLVRLAEADAVRIADAQVAALGAMELGDRIEEFRAHFTRHLAATTEPPDLGAADGRA